MSATLVVFNTEGKADKALVISESEIKERILQDRPSVTWQWLAGFHQAEGYAGAHEDQRGYFRPTWRLSQKDIEILQRVRDFLTKGSFGVSRSKFGEGNYLRMSRRSDTIEVLCRLLPYLWFVKKDQANNTLKILGLEVVSRQEELSWDFLVGFFEGDGTLGYSIQTNNRKVVQVKFCQKDPRILGIIRDRLSSFGPTSQSESGGTLRLSVVDRSGDLRKSLLRSSISYPRRVQLVISLASEGLLDV